MIHGVLIAESLRPDVMMDSPGLVIRKLTRWTNPDPGVGQTRVWSILEFDTEADPDELGRTLASVLDAPGWYIDFHSETTTYVVFPDKTFSYPRGDEFGRGEAVAYALTVGVPESQCDWGK